MIEVIRTEEGKPIFALHTAHTSYAMQVLPSGHIEHMHYGRRIHVESSDGLQEQHVFPPGDSCIYSPEYTSFTLDDMRLEISSLGKGDTREPLLELIHADGSRTSDFLYTSYEVNRGKEDLSTLPSSYGTEEEVETLKIILTDTAYQLHLSLFYHVYEAWDVITKHVILENAGDTPIIISRLLSNQLDLEPGDYIYSTFNGAWTREMHRTDTPVSMTKLVNASTFGVSSNAHKKTRQKNGGTATESISSTVGITMKQSNRTPTVKFDLYPALIRIPSHGIWLRPHALRHRNRS